MQLVSNQQLFLVAHTLSVEVPHANFTEVTWMVLVHVGSVVVLTSSKTTTTGMLSCALLSLSTSSVCT
jgi:hypothetical protein